MQIWVDADACPKPVRDILVRAARRREVQTTFVANQFLQLPPSPFIRAVKVAQGFDVADDRIAIELTAGDLVITADIPLAAAVVRRDALALNPRGTLYTTANVAEHLARRNLLEELRSSGQVSGGPPALGKADIQAFANQLDRLITRDSGLK
ncbi:uncharacterized protein YaiI (UPF0178 family) [Methylohalomonas lacus]|uniref:UPF0178 protein J2T55_000740 n=1 Tax=Methylohalomonas lacus TaxID=398773 RepID=A0AAE3HI27_9GAMM|nr:YaiI/YqxD family protein [Methylohalomonas lacus]MCS3902736.1 uncharacterized protein YaiI (UPF0178 family) [Methylohalomonas lacus]